LRHRNSHVIFSNDEGRTWTAPRELPAALTGDRHAGRYAPDGRLFISFRDMTRESATKGDWAGWVGTYEDIAAARDGQYRVRIMRPHTPALSPSEGERVPEGRVRGIQGSWPQLTSSFWRCLLSMNRGGARLRRALISVVGRSGLDGVSPHRSWSPCAPQTA